MLAAIVISTKSAVAWCWDVEALTIQEDRYGLCLCEHYNCLERQGLSGISCEEVVLPGQGEETLHAGDT